VSIAWPTAPFPQTFRITPTSIYPQMAEFNNMSAGPPKGRAIDTTCAAVHSGTLLLTSVAQVQTWITFFKTTTSFGTTPFLWSDPITGATQSYIMNPNAGGNSTTIGLTHLGGTVWELSLTIQEAIPS
jgi:hypothetical protein